MTIVPPPPISNSQPEQVFWRCSPRRRLRGLWPGWAHNPGGGGLPRLLGLLTGHWQTIAGCLAVGLTLGIVVTHLQVPLYRADATLKILSVQPNGLEAVGATAADNMRAVETARAQLLSRTLSANVVAALALGDDRDFSRSRTSLLPGWFRTAIVTCTSGPSNAPTHQCSALERVQAGLSAEVMANTSLVSVSYRHPDPEQARRVLDQLTRGFVEVMARERARLRDEALRVLMWRADAAPGQLPDAELALADLAHGTGIAATADDLAPAPWPIARRRPPLVGAIADRLPSHQLVVNMNMDRPRTDDLTPVWPDRERVLRPAAVLAAHQAHWPEHESRFAAPNITHAMTLGALDARSIRDQTFTERRDAFEIDASVNLPVAIIVDRPVVHPHSPRPVLNMTLAGFLSMFAAAVVIGVRETFEDRISTADDVTRGLGLPLMGAVPNFGGDGRLHSQPNHGRAATEAMHWLRIAIEAVRLPMPSPVLAIASAEHGEGRTMLVHLLAHEFAAVGRRVLVIDADFRRPSQHALFDKDIGTGLGNLLVNQREPVSRHVLVRRTELPLLDVMTAGAIPADPSNALASERMGLVLERCRRHYDLILVDSPAIGGFSDAAVIARWADAVLMVVAEGRISRSAAIDAVNWLDCSGGHVLGVAMTAPKTVRARGGRRSGRRYGDQHPRWSDEPEDVVGWEGYAIAETGASQPPMG